MAAGGGLAQEVVAPDEADVTARFIDFLKAATDRRDSAGARRRFNQARATACVDAEFEVPDGLAPDRRVGLFAAPGRYRARIRFANAVSASDRDRDVRGMSIRVFDAAMENLTPGVTAQDFVLNSHPVMMAPDTRGFMELLQANEAGGVRRTFYFLGHPTALRIALASRANPSSHLDIPYWSTTPYLFGPGRAVKYIVRPASTRRSPKPEHLTDTYLRDALRQRLTEGDATFDFMIQFQVDARRTPIEDATVEWRQEDAPYVAVARIRIPPQSFESAENVDACERLTFNPWHCRPDHRPLGSMNRARREIYRAMAEFRAAPAQA